jgi:hypothetical protein
MPARSAHADSRPKSRRFVRSMWPPARAGGAVVSFIVLGLALRLAFRTGLGGAVLESFEKLLFGSLSGATAVFSLGWAALIFGEIVVAYRKTSGFHWLAGLSFGAAAFNGIMALHALLS